MNRALEDRVIRWMLICRGTVCGPHLLGRIANGYIQGMLLADRELAFFSLDEAR